MKQILYLVPLLILFSCKKNDTSIPDNTPLLSFDSLKILSSNLPIARYTDLTFINETTGFAVAQGLVAKTRDGGTTWTAMPLPTNIWPNRIQFTDSQTGYVIGGDNTFGALLKTTDGGQNWSMIYLKAPESPYGLFFLDNNTGFLTGMHLFIKTTDGGQTWTNVRANNLRVFQDVKFKNNNEGYVTSNGGVYFKTSDGGNSWDSLQYNRPSALSDIYFTEDNTVIVRSGDTLVDLANGYPSVKMPSNATKFVFFTPQRSIAIGAHYVGDFDIRGDIFITNNGWKTFTQKTFADAGVFTAIAKMNDHKIMILGAGAKVMVLNR